jgi:hypothetical protein
MRLLGLSFPSEGPFLFPASFLRASREALSRLSLRNCCHRFDPPQHGNPRFPEHVRDFRFP